MCKGRPNRPSPILFHLSKQITLLCTLLEHFAGVLCPSFTIKHFITTASVHVTFLSNKSALHMVGTIGVIKCAKCHFLSRTRSCNIFKCSSYKNLTSLFLHVLVVILTNGSCKIFKDSCKNHTRLFLHVLVVILTNGSCKTFKDSCKNHKRLFLRVLVVILTNDSCKIFKDSCKNPTRLFLHVLVIIFLVRSL